MLQLTEILLPTLSPTITSTVQDGAPTVVRVYQLFLIIIIGGIVVFKILYIFEYHMFVCSERIDNYNTIYTVYEVYIRTNVNYDTLT